MIYLGFALLGFALASAVRFFLTRSRLAELFGWLCGGTAGLIFISQGALS